MRTLLLAILASALVAPSPASACSKFPFQAPLDRSVEYLIGDAMADTLFAGSGNVSFDAAGGPDRPVYGQLQRVDAIGGPAVAELPQGVEEVVLVPWGYRADCVPIIWEESARWVDPGTRGFYLAELRPREHWVGERPTFDVYTAYQLPYLVRERPHASMNLEEVFALYEVLPTVAEIDAGGMAALAELRDWAGENPDLAERFPASYLVNRVSSSAARVELSSIEHPAHGSWRFEIELPGGAIRGLFGRTDPSSTNAWNPERAPRLLGRPSTANPFHFSAPVGLTLLLRIWEDDPAVNCVGSTQRIGYLHTLAAPEGGGARAGSWAGWIDWNFLRAALCDDPVAQQIVGAERERYDVRSAARLPVETPATFTWGPDGVLRVHQSYALTDGGEITVRGERISLSVGR